MERVILALSGALPAIVLMVLIGRYDDKRPEPQRQLLWVTALGGLSTIPVIFVQLAMEKANPGGVSGALYTALFVAALTEETAKALALYFAVWRHPAFDERLDGIVYATRAGLGFALVENIGYLAGAESISGLFGIFVVRAILALSRAQRLEVVAEGIETDAQRRALLSLGAEIGQGYFFAKPASLDAILAGRKDDLA